MYALVDADILVHRAVYAAEKISYYLNHPSLGLIGPKDGSKTQKELIQWCEEEMIQYDKSLLEKHVLVDDEITIGAIVNAIATKLEEDLALIGVTKMRYILTGLNSKDHNFRFDIKGLPTPYKAGRREKPEHFNYTYNLIAKRCAPVSIVEGYEADDALIIARNQLKKKGIESIIVSRDKDLKQSAGKYFDIETRMVENISQEQAYRNLWFQVIQGDAVDNIPGLYGWANDDFKKHLKKTHYIKNATNTLNTLTTNDEMKEYVLGLYRQVGLSEKEMDITYSLVKLLEKKPPKEAT